MAPPVIYWMDGFDHYTNIALKYNSQYGNLENTPSLTPPAITSAAARFGAGGLVLTNGGCIYKGLPDLSTLGFGVAFRFTANPPAAGRKIVSFWDEGVQNLYLFLNSARRIGIVNSSGASIGSSSTTFALNAWYYLEFSVVFAAIGAYILGVNGVIDVQAAGVVTNGTANNRTNILRMGSTSFGLYPFHYDDLYVSDGTLLGPCLVDTPANQGTYPVNSPSASVGAVNLTDYADITVGGAVHAVAVHTLGHKAYGNTRAIRNAIKPSGVTFYGTPHYLTTTDLYHTDIFNTNPATAGTWTPPTFNTAQIGFDRYI